MKTLLISAALCLSLSACASAPKKQGVAMDIMAEQAKIQTMLSIMSGDASSRETPDMLAKIQAASEHPLGSIKNPVRAFMPDGQADYLKRLNCADGLAPDYRRTGALGEGIYGMIIDGYEVKCSGGAPQTVIMDMYFPGYEETKPVDGFTIDPVGNFTKA